MDEDFFCSSEFDSKKKTKIYFKSKNNIADIQTERANYFQKAHDIILEKNNSYSDRAKVFDISDKPKISSDNSKTNYAYQSNEFIQKAQF
jgi:hypothetical protein